VPHLAALGDQVAKLLEFVLPVRLSFFWIYYFTEPSTSQFAQEVGIYVADVRAQKHPFALTAILTKLRQVAVSSFGNKTSPWDAVGDAITAVTQIITTLYPQTLEADNVIKSKHIAFGRLSRLDITVSHLSLWRSTLGRSRG